MHQHVAYTDVQLAVVDVSSCKQYATHILNNKKLELKFKKKKMHGGDEAGAIEVSIRQQHTSAYVSIRQHMPAAYACSIRQHTSAYVSIRQHMPAAYACSIRQHTLAYVSICQQHTPAAYVSIRQHTSAYVLSLPIRLSWGHSGAA
jgi:hypothetical protein